MGLFVKKNHGTEYLYSLAGKKQFFLGRNNDPPNINQENLRNAIDIINKNFDKQFEKYVEDFNDHISYMPKNLKLEYAKKRKKKIEIKLQKVK